MSRDDTTSDSAARRAVSIVVAARRLNLTSDAVRLRLKRRTLEGYRDNRGRWMVYLDSARNSARTDDQAFDQSETTNDRSPDQASLIKDMLARLETLEKDRPADQTELIAELRARLADRGREAEQLRLDLERERAGAAERIEQHKALTQQIADLLARIDDKDRRHEQERRELRGQIKNLTDSLARIAADRRSLWQRLFGRAGEDS